MPTADELRAAADRLPAALAVLERAPDAGYDGGSVTDFFRLAAMRLEPFPFLAGPIDTALAGGG